MITAISSARPPAQGGTLSPNILIAAPKLGPLLDNGGRYAGAGTDSQIIPTQALLPGSPAIGKGSNMPLPPNLDERGFARPAKLSIGAYEPQYVSAASLNQVFVENVYETLFNRVADPGGLNAWTSYLNGPGTPLGLIQMFQSTTEYLNDETAALYQGYLDRAPSSSEMGTITGLLKSGVTPEQIAAVLVGSGEFFQDYGGNTDVFVEAAFQATLGRSTATPAEFTAWDQALLNGASRATVESLLLTTTEYLTDIVTVDFEAYLGREPMPSDLSAFLGEARSGAPSPTLAAIALAGSYAVPASLAPGRAIAPRLARTPFLRADSVASMIGLHLLHVHAE